MNLYECIALCALQFRLGPVDAAEHVVAETPEQAAQMAHEAQLWRQSYHGEPDDWTCVRLASIAGPARVVRDPDDPAVDELERIASDG